MRNLFPTIILLRRDQRIGSGLSTHLFVKVPRRGDSEETFSVFESSCHLLPWASAAGGRGACPPWIFIHGTNIVNKGLIVIFFGLFLLFFGLFLHCPPSPWKRNNSAILRSFFRCLFLMEIFLPTPLPATTSLTTLT